MQNSNYGTEAIAEAATNELETWPNNWPHQYVIHLEHPEYAALCPRSGYPDTGAIIVDYIPNANVIELKAFKLYINSFRDERISHENATNQIAFRLFDTLKPYSLRVIGDFTRRGGVKTVITCQLGSAWEFGQYRPQML